MLILRSIIRGLSSCGSIWPKRKGSRRSLPSAVIVASELAAAAAAGDGWRCFVVLVVVVGTRRSSLLARDVGTLAS